MLNVSKVRLSLHLPPGQYVSTESAGLLILRPASSHSEWGEDCMTSAQQWGRRRRLPGAVLRQIRITIIFQAGKQHVLKNAKNLTVLSGFGLTLELVYKTPPPTLLILKTPYQQLKKHV